MFESETDGSAVMLQRMCSAARAEACAAAERLCAIGDLVSLRTAQDGGAGDDWALDAIDAAAIEVAAALGISRGLAASHLRYAHAMRLQLPQVGRAFRRGDIDEATFRACVFRTGLIVDDDVLSRVDEQLAVAAPRWGVLNESQLAARIDKVVSRVDLDAVRRRKERIAGRDVYVGSTDNGLADIDATVFATDAFAFSERLTALAATVCDADPRTVAERRADAVGAMAAGVDRLGCRCNTPDCPAGGKAASPVVIHVVAEQGTVEGTGGAPGVLPGCDGLIPPELIAQLAASARLHELTHPTDTPAETGYTPSRALATFVRCRDMTCRFPGCNRPAFESDIDHTIPHPAGPTQASNLKCLCRFHHLAKTFWGWHDQQLVDGTVIWTSPTGERYVTHPGSALIFPGLCAPTAPVKPVFREAKRCNDKTAMMPRRRQARAKSQAAAIDTERRRNHQRRTRPRQPVRYVDDTFIEYADTFNAQDSDPPPF